MKRLSPILEPVKPAPRGASFDPPISSSPSPTLSDEQRAAIECSGPVLVHAGAGAGKTSVLAHRVAHFIAQGIDPFEILAVAFSAKAAHELRNRIEQLLPADQAGRVTICTLHALGLRMLRDYSDVLGYLKASDAQSSKRSPRVCNEQDRLRLIKQFMRSEATGAVTPAIHRLTVDEVATAISLAKCQGKSPQDYRATATTPTQCGLALIYQQYDLALHAAGQVDFDDLILGPIRLLDENSEAREFYQSRWQRILVDEMQDLSPAQYRLLRLLADRHRQLTVIGDAAQSVFAFRGALGAEAFAYFRRDFPEASEVHLPHNYRSSATIVLLGDTLMGKQGRRQIAMRLTGEPVSLVRLSCERREADMVAEAITQAVTSGAAGFADCAVLCRTNAQLGPIEHAFATAKVPYVVVGRGGFFQHPEVKQLLAFLSLSQDFTADPLSLQAITSVHDWLPVATQTALIAQSDELLAEHLFDAERLSALTEGQRASAIQLQSALLQLDERKECAPSAVLDFILADDGLAYGQHLRRRHSVNNLADALMRVSALRKLAEPCARIGDFLDEMAMWSGENPLSSLAQNQVSVLTLHDAKGLEFRLVFLVGMEDGLIPHFKARDTRRGLEEELRLAYVGFTRATDVLCISYAQTRNGRPTNSSSFLRGLPAGAVRFGPPSWEQLAAIVQGGSK